MICNSINHHVRRLPPPGVRVPRPSWWDFLCTTSKVPIPCFCSAGDSAVLHTQQHSWISCLLNSNAIAIVMAAPNVDAWRHSFLYVCLYVTFAVSTMNDYINGGVGFRFKSYHKEFDITTTMLSTHTILSQYLTGFLANSGRLHLYVPICFLDVLISFAIIGCTAGRENFFLYSTITAYYQLYARLRTALSPFGDEDP